MSVFEGFRVQLLRAFLGLRGSKVVDHLSCLVLVEELSLSYDAPFLNPAPSTGCKRDADVKAPEKGGLSIGLA